MDESLFWRETLRVSWSSSPKLGPVAGDSILSLIMGGISRDQQKITPPPSPASPPPLSPPLFLFTTILIAFVNTGHHLSFCSSVPHHARVHP